MKKITKRELVAAVLGVLLLFSAAAATPEEQPSESILNPGDTWELPLHPGAYCYSIEYLDGDMFATVNTMFLNVRSEVLSVNCHTLVRDKRMSLRQEFRTRDVAEGGESARIRFECDSGKVRVVVTPMRAEEGS
ncbi:MAG: hypothetical protein V3573_12025 [Desulfovibrionaceae bacterium]